MNGQLLPAQHNVHTATRTTGPDEGPGWDNLDQ